MNIRTPFLNKRGGVLLFWACKFEGLRERVGKHQMTIFHHRPENQGL